MNHLKRHKPAQSTMLSVSASIRSESGIGALAMFASALMFAANSIVAKTAMTTGGMDPFRLVSLRTLFAGAILLVFLAVIRPSELKLTRRALARLVPLGVVGLAALQGASFSHIQRLPIGVGMLIQYIAPLLVAVTAHFVFKERLRGRAWIALAVALAGLVMVSRVQPGVSLDPVGLAFAGVAAVCMAVYLILGEKSAATSSPLAAQTWMVTFAALTWQVFRPFWTFDFTTLAAPVQLPAGFGGGTVALGWLVAYIVVAGTLIPYGLVLYGIRRTGAALAGMIAVAEPLVGAALAWLLLDEVLSPLQVVGIMVSLAGVLLAVSARSRRQVAPLPAE